MKKVFIVLSSIIISLLLVIFNVQNFSTILSSSFDSIIVEYNGDNESYQEIYESLDSFAKEKNGTVVKVVNESDIGIEKTKYAFFGESDSFGGLDSATDFDNRNTPVSGTYKTIGGISIVQLKEFFQLKGYETHILPSANAIALLSTYVVGPSFYGILICLLAFMAFEILDRINQIKTNGIELISGKEIKEIAVSQMKKNLLVFFFAIILSISIGSILLFVFGIRTLLFYKILYIGLLLYFITMVLMDLAITLVHVMVLRTTKLMDFIKGKMPVHKIIMIVMACQIVAIFATTYGGTIFLRNFSQYNMLMSAKEKWLENENLVNLTSSTTMFSTSGSFTDVDIMVADFAKKELEKNKAFFVMNSFLPGLNMTDEILFVSANYFERETGVIDEKEMEELKYMEDNSFALIVPESKKEDLSLFKMNVMTNYLNMMTRL